MKKIAYLSIGLGATLWGIIAIFVQGLYHLGFNSEQIVALRVLTAAIILVLYLLITNRELLKIKLKDWFYFVGTGILSFVFFNWCYFTAIQEISLSIAVVLLYTAPAFVAVISRFVFDEKFTITKIISLFLTTIGIALVIGLFSSGVDHLKISMHGIFIGVGSGFGYALYSIFGKAALKKYHSLTITTYTFVFASFAIVPFSQLGEKILVFHQLDTWFYTIGLGLFPTVLAVYLYTIGLNQIESSRASIIATIEPIVATLLGIFMYGDILSGMQILGIFFVIFAIILAQDRRNQDIKRSDSIGY